MSGNESLIRILLIGETREARRLRGLLDSNGSSQFRVAHAPGLEAVSESLAQENADVLLLDIGQDPSRGPATINAARAAAPEMPLVILAEAEDESLAVESLQKGAQDFLTKKRLDAAALARSLRYAIERHRLQKTLQTLSLLDDLTGLHNRRGFLQLAEQHLRLILRKGAALLIYLDVDGLKEINDTHGHLEGSRALVATANVLRACFRQSDIIARLGGDEFCILMTDAGQDTALQVRQRLQQRVDSTNTLSAWPFRLSLSVGIADVSAVPQPSLDDLLRLADTLMYEQKRGKPGRASAPFRLKHTAPA